MEPMISYIHFDPITRELLGGYLQVPPETHEYRIVVPDDVRMSWGMYMLNEEMTEVKKNPYYWPEFWADPNIPPWEQPQAPPVDPDPEEPVQFGN